jgi:malonyl-CoA O-methyltransferase
MEERLEWIVKKPARWLNWMPLRGGLQAHALLQKRYAISECFVHETPAESARVAHKLIAPKWWQPAYWTRPRPQFALPSKPVEMLWANMVLHHSADPEVLIAQWHKLVAVDGFLMFSCLGPDTLRELRKAFAEQGWPEPTHQFTDMHDWGDMLVHAGFAEPVMDMERITLSYSSPETLLAELRTLGRNLHVARFQGLRGKAWREQLHAALRTHATARDVPGRLQLTFEVIYGHAFKPQPRLRVQSETTFSLNEMRETLRHAKPLR